MPRPLRIEYSGARYHVLSRGDRREEIVWDDLDRLRFIDTLGEAAIYASWQVHAFCLMRNHFHLVIETPDPTLVKGMKWFLGTYTVRFNTRHKVCGHLFAGRYKAIVVDECDDGYLRRVCDYTHLNPARSLLVGADEPLESYRWSSYPLYLKSPGKRPPWLRVDRLLGSHSIAKDNAAGRREFAHQMESRRSEVDPEVRQTAKRGWRLGAEDFLARLQDRMEKPPSENHLRAERQESQEARALRILADELRKANLTQEDLATLPKSHPDKVAIATRIHRETTMTLRWIANALKMGTWRYVSFLLHRGRS